MIRRHRTMFESNAHPFVGGYSRDRFPKREQLRHEILKRFINWLFSFWIPFQFNHRPGKTSHRPYSQVSGNPERAKKNRAGELALGGIKRILIKGADS